MADEPVDPEEFESEQEHWSSPNGCSADCPACAEERENLLKWRKAHPELENENCLAGIACPKCHQRDEFVITGVCDFDVTDDGSEAIGDHEWGDESPIECKACKHRGTVKEFTEPELAEGQPSS